MEIKKGSKVSLTYQLYLDDFDGELFESADKNEPLVFTIGSEEMLEAFESHILGMKVGDTFKLKIDMDDAYGEETEDSIGAYPHDVFAENVDDLPEAGTFVPMEDEDGTEYEAFVAQVTEDEVILDFNHPLAGEDLYITGEVIAVE
jgi:FKBP-type peptidyl-prolyl cis-trans isomerase SlyD